VFLVANHQGSGSDPAAVRVTREGFPVLDGLRPFLTGVRCLLDYRDYQSRPPPSLPDPDSTAVDKWCRRLGNGDTLGEHESQTLLSVFGFPVNPTALADTESAAIAAAANSGYPVVVKTAEAGILHKTDCGGVKLGIENEEQLKNAYLDLAARLGPRVLISPMLNTGGVEMVFGLIHDEQFGPLVMLGFGGINVETIRDVTYALPPFDRATARRLLNKLQLRPLLDGQRGRPAVDMEAYCAAAERFSVMATALGNVISEIDVNPVIVHKKGCIAVDALVVGREFKASED
jgi:acyl-CoA synthetase (NDP forming)